MGDVRDLIVLSDLHLAPERGRGLFRADAELAAFVDWITTETGPAQVVIAGDFLDFLVPGEKEATVPAFDPAGAPARATAILEHHPEVFDALSRLLRSPRHELWILSGNHDPELLLPEVQEIVEQRLALRDSSSRLRWRVEGEALRFRIGGAVVLVAHGDLFDEWNHIDHGALRRAVNRISHGFALPKDHEYTPPIGSRMVVEHVLPLRHRYPWVDALKPEREAVFPILWQFLDASAKLDFLRLVGYALQQRVASFLNRMAMFYSPAKLVRAPGDLSPRQRLEEWFGEQQRLLRSSSTEESDSALIARLRKVSSEDGFFDPSTPDESSRLVPLLLGRGADLVVVGHTHAAKAYPLEKGLYLNAGAWVRLLQLPERLAPDEDWQKFLADLEAGGDLGAERPTLARVTFHSGGEGIRASLLLWNDGITTQKPAFHFSPHTHQWMEE